MELEQAYSEGKPYFGNTLLAEQGSQHFAGFPIIVDIVRKAMQQQRLRILEVGSWAGHSLVAWNNATQSNCELTCIDHWQPYLVGSEYGVMTKAAETGDIKKLFMHNMNVCGLLPRLTILEGDSESRLKELYGREFDIVFLDGDHMYASVLRDIKLAKSLVAVGGVICGDDLDKQFPDVIDKIACNRSNGEGKRFHIQDANGVGYHAGVTQAVYEALGRVYCYGRLWWKQRWMGTW